MLLTVAVLQKHMANNGNSFRREWDKEAFNARAKARLEAELGVERADAHDGERERKNADRGVIVQRAPLQRRTEDLRLAKHVNTRQVVSGADALSGQMASTYYCKVCECALRDSANYLLHINGKKHNRMLGMSMCAERSTLGEVRARLDAHREAREGEEADLTADEKAARYLEDFDDRMRQREAEEKAEAAAKRKARGAAEGDRTGGGSGSCSKGSAVDADTGWCAEPDMEVMMGFGGFGGSKKRS